MKDNNDPVWPSSSGTSDDDSTLPSESARAPERRIGPYRLLECIGRGGMGEVYLAEQTAPIRRRVAVKLIKAGMDSREVIARFESERQALALMNHANVARIFDAGTTDAGRPYFVMEYVPGEPITEYCDRHKLDLRSRLELFIPVCQAIHHAHQKGIIHRDIKPTNVLVAVEDGRPVPKVIDFGVAKAIRQALTDRTLHTMQGRMIGTPAYMSPEQAEMTGLNVDTTSDVYSLGVLLYELLVGRLPFDTEELLAAGVAEINRIIREVDPPRPSTRAGTLGDAATTMAAKRSLPPRTWLKQLHGELDWITMRAMEKDRTRRYQSAVALADDIHHHLNGQPVDAGPPSVRYRLGKTVRRHRGAFLAVAAVFVALSLGLTAAVGSSIAANRARQRAEWRTYLSGLRLAQSALEARETAASLEALAACPEPLRGWEWRYLASRADRSAAVLLRGDTTNARLAWLGPRNELAIGTADGVVRIVATTPPYASRILTTLEGPVAALAANADGSELAAAALRDSVIRILDVQDGGVRLAMARPGPLPSVALDYASVPGVLFAGDPFGLSIFDASSGGLRTRILDDGRRPPNGRPFGPGSEANFYTGWRILGGGTRVAVCGPHIGDLARVYDLDGNELLQASPDIADQAWGLRAAAGSSRAYAYLGWASRDTILEDQPVSALVLDVGDGRISLVRMPEKMQVQAMALTPGDRVLLAGFERGPIAAWDVATSRHLADLSGHTGRVVDLAVSADGRRMASAAEDGTVRLWLLDGLRTPPTHTRRAPLTSLLRDATTGSLAVMVSDGRVCTWADDDRTDVRTARVRARSPVTRPLALVDGRLYGCAGVEYLFRYGSTRRGGWVTGGASGLQTWILEADGSTTVRYRSDPPDSAAIGAMAIAADGSCLALSRADPLTFLRMPGSPAPRGLRDWRTRNLQVLRFGDGKVLAEVDEDGPRVTALAIDPASRLVAVGTDAGEAFVLDIGTQQRQTLAPAQAGPIHTVEWSGSGRYLAAAADDNTVAVWDVARTARLTTLQDYDQGVGAVRIDEDADRIYTLSPQQVLRVWHLTTGELLLTIRDPRFATMPNLALAAEDDRLLVTTGDGVAVLDPATPFTRFLSTSEAD